MTDQDIEALRREYRGLEARRTENMTVDELATTSHRMGEILAKLQDAGIDTYPGLKIAR